MRQGFKNVATGKVEERDMTTEEVSDREALRTVGRNAVPQRISRLQVIEQAEAEGKWDQLKAAMQSHPTAWDKFMACDYVSRNHPLIPVIGAILQKDDAGMDLYFRQAAKLK